MSDPLLDLSWQARLGLEFALPKGAGGTGRTDGGTPLVIVDAYNDDTATIPRGALVKQATTYTAGPGLLAARTTAAADPILGVALEDIAVDVSGPLAMAGAPVYVLTTGTVTVGDLLYPSTTTGRASTAGGSGASAIGRALNTTSGTSSVWALLSVKSETATDHGTLSGLVDDDHTQYVLRSLLTAAGDMPYRNGANWTRSPIGGSNTALKSIGNAPVWSSNLNLEWLDLNEWATPSSPPTPASGKVRLYGSNLNLYQKDSAGAISGLAGGGGGGGGAPTSAQYLVGAADGSLTNEKVKAAVYDNYDPDEYPTSGTAAQTDEFEDGSIHADWAWTSSPTAHDETTFPGYLYIDDVGNAGAYRYFRRSYSPGATDFTVVAKCSVTEPKTGTAGGAQIGIALLDSADALIWRQLVLDSGAASQMTRNSRINDTNAGSYDVYFPLANLFYLLIQRTSGNVYTAFWSLDGIIWNKGGSSTVATTVAKVAIAWQSGSTDQRYGVVDFIRVFDSLTKKIGV